MLMVIGVVVVLAGVIILKVKATSEERLLEQVFGPTYRDYRRRVSQLVPGAHLFAQEPDRGGRFLP